MSGDFWWGVLALPLGAVGVAVIVAAAWLISAFIDSQLVIINPSDRQRKRGRTYSSRYDHGASVYASRRAYLWRLFGVRVYFVFGRVSKERFKAAQAALYTVPEDGDAE